MPSPDPSLKCHNTQFRHCVLDDKGCCLNCDRGKCGLCGSESADSLCDTCVEKMMSNDKPLIKRIRECEGKNE